MYKIEKPIIILNIIYILLTISSLKNVSELLGIAAGNQILILIGAALVFLAVGLGVVHYYPKRNKLGVILIIIGGLLSSPAGYLSMLAGYNLRMAYLSKPQKERYYWIVWVIVVVLVIFEFIANMMRL